MRETRELSGFRLILAEPGTKFGIVVAVLAFMLAMTGFASAGGRTDGATAARVLDRTERSVVTVISVDAALHVSPGRYQAR